ncbi:MAG TPA: fused response regulator/phosphatase [Mucilaginibacter sp.]|nr:fused response regulator/phosphatase [Mucilaginibacter sp.]
MSSPNAKRVLLVDDNALFLKILGHAFAKAGFECSTCLSASEAFDYLNLNIPDAILSDYEMPEMNGIEFRKFLLNNSDYKDIPFVFLSYITDKDLMAEGLDLHAVDYVVKETPVNVIVSKIGNLIDTVQKQRELSVLEIKKAALALNIRTVPKVAPVVTGFDVDFWHQAYQDVPGGDFIDFIEVDERYSYIVLGDVMGKKWVAWFFTFSFLSYIRAAIRFGIMNRDFSTAEILQKVNSVICYDNALKDILSTMSLVMIDKQEQVVTYSGAGDLPMLHYRACTGVIEQVESSGLLLGLFPDGGYTEQRIELKPGDQLFVFTDGLIDYEDENGEKKSDYNLFKDKLLNMINDKLNFKQIRQSLLQNLSPALVDDCSIINISKP